MTMKCSLASNNDVPIQPDEGTKITDQSLRVISKAGRKLIADKKAAILAEESNVGETQDKDILTLLSTCATAFCYYKLIRLSSQGKFIQRSSQAPIRCRAPRSVLDIPSWRLRHRLARPFMVPSFPISEPRNPNTSS